MTTFIFYVLFADMHCRCSWTHSNAQLETYSWNF